MSLEISMSVEMDYTTEHDLGLQFFFEIQPKITKKTMTVILISAMIICNKLGYM